MAEYEAVIGLECHVELSTETKMFCGCRNEFGAPPNTNVCPVCLGHPGSLPVPEPRGDRAHHQDRARARQRDRAALALPPEELLLSGHAEELPDQPVRPADLRGRAPRRRAARRLHEPGRHHARAHGGGHRQDAPTRARPGASTTPTPRSIDFNRAGVPLVECVSEPDIRSPEEAGAYLRELRATLESLDVSDVRMEEGSLRCDANVSMRPAGTDGARHEGRDQEHELDPLARARARVRDRAPDQGARGRRADRPGDPPLGRGRRAPPTSMRSKEEAFDYRYFPEPDIPALEPDGRVGRGAPRRAPGAAAGPPRAVRGRARPEARGRPRARRRPGGVRALRGDGRARAPTPPRPPTGSRRTSPGWLNKQGPDAAARVTPRHLADLWRSVADGTISGAGREAGARGSVRRPATTIDAIVERRGLRQVSDAGELGAIADEVIAENPDAVAKFRAGKEGVIGFLVGQVMKASSGSANPKLAQELLRERLQG